MTLSVGAKVAATLALLLLLAAAYLLWSPIQLYPSDGFPIMCGTGASPPTDELGTAACGQINQIRQWQAGALAVAALVVLGGAIYAFGVNRRTEALIGREPVAADAGRED
ncbi:hypothetical protein ASG74_12105 [Knoellia sp. Soil729]|nr:hypothetical protein ASG74_12105 [Knoellia sp. Soil729]